MTTITHDDRCEALDEALTKLQEVRELLDAAGLLHDPAFRAYHAATLEGRDGGWLGGPFLIDVVREAFDAAERGEFDTSAIDEPHGRCENGHPLDCDGTCSLCDDVEPCSDCGEPVRYSDDDGYRHVDPSASPSCFQNWDQQGRPAVVS